MDTDKLKTLMSAIDTGSISAAAQELSYTPSGISRSIASLEEMTGFPLLIRGKSGVRPTPECEKLLPVIRNLLFSAEQFESTAAQICGVERGTVRLGSAYPLYNRALASMIVEFRVKHPGIDIYLTEGTSSELCERLCMHELDLCIISRRENAPVFIPLVTDRLCVWVREGHPACREGVYQVRDLEAEDHIQICSQGETDNSIFLSKYRIRPRVRASTADIYSAYSMVEAGLGVALINEILSAQWQGGVRTLPLDTDYRVEIGLASQAPEESSPAAAAFLDFIKERFGSILQQGSNE